MDRAALERMPSRRLHDMAVDHAVKHLDVAFLWDLLRSVPTAEAAAGHLDEAKSDVVSLTALISDLVTAGDEEELTEALRPLYVGYLERHA